MKRLKSRGHVDLVVLTPGAASQLQSDDPDLIVDKPEKIFQRFWTPGSVFVVIGAIGAVVRLISPFVSKKELDPAVIVIDSLGKYIVPILGGHKAGADEIAGDLSKDLGGESVFTGFSKTQERISLDSFGDAWGWIRSGKTSDWNKLMFEVSKGLKVFVDQKTGATIWKSSQGASKTFLFKEDKNVSDQRPYLKICSEVSTECCWHPRTLWIGIGCEKNTSQSLLERSLKKALKEAGLAKESIAGIATIDLKVNEDAIKGIQKKFGLPIRIFSPKQLLPIQVPNPSKLVQKEVGTPSVAEASALLASGENGLIRFEKHIYHAEEGEFGAATLAISESFDSFAPSKGELHLVGSGPGNISFLTPDSRYALSRSAIWIGYKPYLDLLEPLRRFDQVRIDSSLKNERLRCQEALKLAIEGARVSLVSSGDSGIYGMAGLALELLLNKDISERPVFKVHPGISAFQSAAAAIGAPLMNDFCAISLSDCLTPWSAIQKRIEAAAASDFVIAFYNPQSQNRDWQLKKALQILLQSRSSSTPIVFARQISRDNEQLEVHTLGTCPIERVDMLTLLLVGNRQTFLKDGCLVTPRGY